MENKTIVKRFKFKRNFLFIQEIKKFLSLIKNKRIIKKNILNLDQEINTLKFAEEIKKKLKFIILYIQIF